MSLSPCSLQRKARSLFQQNQYDDSILLLSEAIEIDPSDYTSFVDRPEVYYEYQQYVESILDSEGALQIRSDSFKD